MIREENQADVQCADTCGMEKLKQGRKLEVREIRSFRRSRKEEGFFFAGETCELPELIYVESGTLHGVVDGRNVMLGQGELILYAPGQWHMEYADIGESPVCIGVAFDGAGILWQNLAGRKFSADRELMRQMCRELERPDVYSADMMFSQLTQLLVQLSRCAAEESRQIPSKENEIVLRAQMYVGAHIREKLSVPLLAGQADVSPSYLTALFHRNLQISPGEYIRRAKLEESRQLIRENRLNFTEIADALQYSTVHHFSRQFKEKFGISPTEYAKNVR